MKKILLAKPGLDGHDVGVKVLGHALVDAGFEVVYTGLRKTVAEIVRMAGQHGVDLIGLSILSGTHLVLCQQMNDEMKKAGLPTPWIVGGNIPDKDVSAIVKTGATAAFPTGTTIEKVIDYCHSFVANWTMQATTCNTPTQSILSSDIQAIHVRNCSVRSSKRFKSTELSTRGPDELAICFKSSMSKSNSFRTLSLTGSALTYINFAI